MFVCMYMYHVCEFFVCVNAFYRITKECSVKGSFDRRGRGGRERQIT